MQVVLTEKEVKKAVEQYLFTLHNLTIKTDLIKFTGKGATNITGAVVTLVEKQAE